jgi:hypothetical protein
MESNVELLAALTKYGFALERIAKYPSADSWECRPLANIAREALGMQLIAPVEHPEIKHDRTKDPERWS